MLKNRPRPGVTQPFSTLQMTARSRNEFRALLAATLAPLFQHSDWYNPKGATDAAYYARLAVEFADAIISEVEKGNKEGC